MREVVEWSECVVLMGVDCDPGGRSGVVAVCDGIVRRPIGGSVESV